MLQCGTEKVLTQKDRIEGERKQVTVMLCDLEGFTALSEQLAVAGVGRKACKEKNEIIVYN